ncbi:MAG TPA: HAD family hydrolase [Blastocatellia bacterium]|nr:HAD family hydrolase [Blastocatellia bacterium]
MRYFALACDYDGTIAGDGRVSETTIAALERLRASGRKLILVTGRELDELLGIFPRIDLFERVVAENGALLYCPTTRGEKLLGERPPEEFVNLLSQRGVGPISVGRVIVATWHPHENVVLETIRDLGLELQVIFNKGAVMVLPSGVNKATGLTAALGELSISPHNTVAVGDAENDHAFLALCECAVAVANALPTLKDRADLVTAGDHGTGVIELIDRMTADDLGDLASRLTRHDIALGVDSGDHELRLKAWGTNLLLAGSSQGGKTTLTTGLIERLTECKYQLCVIDPEGDYAGLEGAVTLGDADRAPRPEEVLELLARPEQNVIINLLGLSLEHRPPFFIELFPRIQELRARTGHPHWLVVDEAHHLLPASWTPAQLTLPQGITGLMMITVQPDFVAPAVLSVVDTLIAIGEAPERTIRLFCEAVGETPPATEPVTLNPGEGLLWVRQSGASPVWFRSIPPSGERRRHHRKYAEGELAPELSFYFKGPEGKLNLRAQNLIIFLQMADGVDDETWLHHLRGGEYSRWFRDVIKDEELAEEAEQVERMPRARAEETRALIREAIERRYTAPV